MKNIALFLLLSLISIAGLMAQSLEGDGPHSQLIIRGVMLINGNGAPPQGPIDIVVENKRIKKIQVVGYDGVPIDETKRPKLKAREQNPIMFLSFGWHTV